MLPPTYACQEAVGDGAPYPGCLTPLGCVYASSNVRLPGGGGRRGALPGLPDSARLRLAARPGLTARACARCARRPPVGACASSHVRLPGGGGRRGALPGLSDSARLRLAARADLRSALALPPTYACQEAVGDGAPYPGCLTPLGSACASSDVRPHESGGRRDALPGLFDSARLRLAARADLRSALALPPTYACQEAEGDGGGLSRSMLNFGRWRLRENESTRPDPPFPPRA